MPIRRALKDLIVTDTDMITALSVSGTIQMALLALVYPKRGESIVKSIITHRWLVLDNNLTLRV